MSETQWLECGSTRTFTASNFTAGNLVFPIDIQPEAGWIPSKSYVRIEMKLEGAGATQPTLSQIWPTMPPVTYLQMQQFESDNEKSPRSLLTSPKPRLSKLVSNEAVHGLTQSVSGQASTSLSSPNATC